jgi:CDP-glucose 4,6-dehydratase
MARDGNVPRAMSRSVFVTGAYGLLGSWLVQALLERGDDVTVLRRSGTVQSRLVLSGAEDRCTVVDGDVVDAQALDRALIGGADAVFHLAAQTTVGAANRAPAETFDVNIRGTWTLLEACRRAGAGAVVVAASDHAYGPHATLPFREEDFALEPRYPYDVSKAATDLIARSYFHTYGLPVAVTRSSNVYGGGDLNWSRLVPEAVSAALAGRQPVIRSDGSPKRDFIYVEDAVRAFLALADVLGPEDGGARGEAFNVGGDEPHTVREIVELVCRLAGTDVEPDIRGTGTPAAEIRHKYVDSAKLRRTTGWRPEVPLEDGLERTIAWYRTHVQALGAL